MFATKPKLTALAAAAAIAAAGTTGATATDAKPNAQSGIGTKRIATATARLRQAVGAIERSAAKPAIASPDAYGVSQATLDAIASCESGGDPTAVSADGTYHGLYQFDESTWESVGGTGDPAAASPAEQTMRAAILYSRVGASAWPVCGA